MQSTPAQHARRSPRGASHIRVLPRPDGMNIAIVGATGMVGGPLSGLLGSRGHEVRRLSRSGTSYRVDVTTGAGLSGALAGVDIVISASNGPASRKAAAVLVDGTKRLLEATSVQARAGRATPHHGQPPRPRVRQARTRCRIDRDAEPADAAPTGHHRPGALPPGHFRPATAASNTALQTSTHPLSPNLQLVANGDQVQLTGSRVPRP